MYVRTCTYVLYNIYPIAVSLFYNFRILVFFSGSGPHRYIFLAFGHKSRIGGKKTAKVSARKGFNVKEYSEANALGNPNCINFYYTENKD